MTYQMGMVATLPELEAYYKGTEAGDFLELMNQTNDVITDIPWTESNMRDGHLTSIRTGLPEVHFRRLYKGIPPSKSSWDQVKEPCAMMTSLMELDAKLVDLYGAKAAMYRTSEASAFAEAHRQKLAQILFYGDSAADPAEFNGFCKRYALPGEPNVLDAKGSTANKETSLWLVCWGENTVTGIYPQGSKAGFSREDLGRYITIDNNGQKFLCVGEMFGWDAGLAVRDWRAVVRVCNIDTTKLTLRKGQTGWVDLQALTIQAKNQLPPNMLSKAVWYCNRDLKTALELQSGDAGNVHLQYGEFFNIKAVPILHGIPVRQVDVLTSTESVLVAA